MWEKLFSEWEFLCGWCGFKGDILFLRNLEKEVLKKLDSGHGKNISRHVTSEISHYFSVVRLMLWCVCLHKLPVDHSFPGEWSQHGQLCLGPQREALWISNNPNILTWFDECVCALCVLCAHVCLPQWWLFLNIFITHWFIRIKFEDMELRNIRLSEVFWKLGN